MGSSVRQHLFGPKSAVRVGVGIRLVGVGVGMRLVRVVVGMRLLQAVHRIGTRVVVHNPNHNPNP